MVRVCEGGRSAYVRALDKGGRTTTILRNRRFMDYDPKFQTDRDVAMAAVEGTVGGGRSLPWKRLCRRASGYAGSAVRRAGSTVSGRAQRDSKQKTFTKYQISSTNTNHVLPNTKHHVPLKGTF